jgi:uncharacterized protein
MPQCRYINSLVEESLESRMILVGGPRQVGKTTFAANFLGQKGLKSVNYLNWDNLLDRELIRKGKLPLSSGLIVLDELHKYTRWRNLLKGVYDKHKEETQIIVTGSARLDHYRRGGDSLFGRSRFIRLHPFTFSELSNNKQKIDISDLLKFGGFPEPLFKGTERFHRLWQRERVEKIIKEDVRDLENVRDLSLMELLVDALPDRVGSPLSLTSLREDLEVSHDSIRAWLNILENLYLIYRIAPYGAPKIRAVKKEKKLYFWDWSTVINEGSRFENFVASHLLKYCHYLEDSEGYKMELRFIRDTDCREIDFVVLQDKRPLFAVECKTGEKKLSKHITYFKERTNIPHFYQVHMQTSDYGTSASGRVLPFTTFCKELGLV